MVKEAFISLLVFTISAPVATAAVYKCTVDNQPVFSDQPCGEDAREIDHEPAPAIGGRFDTGTDAEFYKPEQRSHRSTSDSCAYIDSTRLRRLIVQNKITRGMRSADVRKSWGSPSSVSTGSTTQWAYHYPDYSSSYVYFKNGCVTNWNGYYRNY